MATYVAYDDAVLGHNPLAYWPMTDVTSTPLPDATGNGRDITSLDGMAFSSQPMFDYAPQSHGLDANGTYAFPSVTDMSSIVSAMNNAKAATFIMWVWSNGGNFYWKPVALDFDSVPSIFPVFQNNGEWNEYSCTDGVIDSQPTAASPAMTEANMIAVMADATHDYIWLNGAMCVSRARSSGTWPTLAGIRAAAGNWTGDDHIAWVALFDKVVTHAELKEMYQRRQFQGQIAGTLTLDGSAVHEAKVRSFRRSDGTMNGEATSAADGTYEITVLDNVECDLLAIPPSGVNARPLAHGPILPEPYEQT